MIVCKKYLLYIETASFFRIVFNKEEVFSHDCAVRHDTSKIWKIWKHNIFLKKLYFRIYQTCGCFGLPCYHNI